jgi:hypothetical protein
LSTEPPVRDFALVLVPKLYRLGRALWQSRLYSLQLNCQVISTDQEGDRYNQEIKYRKEQLATEREKEARIVQFQAEQAESQLKEMQASQMTQMQASNQQMFLSFIQQESQRRHEMEIARLS